MTPTHRSALSAVGLVSLLVCVPVSFAGPSAAATPSVHAPVEDGDDQYNYISGLFERGLHEMVVSEARKFLQEHPRYSRVILVRYRLGQSLFELGDHAAARDQLSQVVKVDSEFRREARFRLAQCSLELGDLDDAAQRFLQLCGPQDDHYLADEAAFYAAEALFRLERFPEAAQSYAACLQKSPDEGFARSALYGMAWALYRSERHATALEALDAFLRRHPEDPAQGEMRFLHGECLLHTGKPKDAILDFRKVTQGDYADDALSALAFAEAELGNGQRAARAFLRLEKDHPQSPLLAEARLHAGIQSHQSGDDRAAAAVLDRLLASGDAEWAAEASYWRGMVARETQGAEAALPWFEQGLARAPTEELKGRLQLARSDALFDAGRFDEANEAYSNMSGSEDALYSSAVASLNAGRPEQAVNTSKTLIQKHPQGRHRIAAHVTLGEGLFAVSDYEAALAAFQVVARAKDDAAAAAERPRALSRMAWCHFHLQRFRQAASGFRALLDEFPEDERVVEASFLEGRSWLRAGDAGKAEKALQAHLSRHRQSTFRADATFDLAQAQLSLGKQKEAEELLDQLTQHGGNETLTLRARFDRAELYAAQDQHDKSLPLLRQVVKGSPPAELLHPALYSLAWSAWHLDQHPEASQALVTLLAAEPGPELSEPALELLASVERSAGRPNQAVQAFVQLRQAAPQSARTAETALVAALALKEAARLNDAAALLEEELRRRPGSEASTRQTFELAFLYQDLGRTEASVAALKKVEQADDGGALAAESAFHRGEALFAAGNFAEARPAYALAARKPSAVQDLATYKLAWTCFRLEDWPAAATTFAQVHEQFPDSVVAGESLFLAGEARFRQGEFALAREILGAFLKQHPDHESTGRARFRRGVACGELKDWDNCRKDLLALEKSHPDFELRAEAGLWIGRAWLGLGRLPDARARFQKLADGESGLLAAEARLGLGHCAIQEGDPGAALGEFLKVAFLYEDAALVAEGLFQAGQCLESMGDAPKAAAQYRELIEKHPDSPWSVQARKRLDAIGVQVPPTSLPNGR